VTDELTRLARAYLVAQRAQERDHTDPVLDWQRSEAHDALMAGLDAAGVVYRNREHAARIAGEIVAGTFAAGGDVLSGNGGDAKMTPSFLAMLARAYTVEMLEGWLDRARDGMRTRTGQVARWRRTLAWLRSEQG
jgi:hypothetical protein